jgi:hypothetical protein
MNTALIPPILAAKLHPLDGFSPQTDGVPSWGCLTVWATVAERMGEKLIFLGVFENVP